MLSQMSGFPSFLWLSTIPWHIHIFFSHSSVTEHTDCSHVFTIVNDAAMNVGVQISLLNSDFIPFRYTVVPRIRQFVPTSGEQVTMKHFLLWGGA